MSVANVSHLSPEPAHQPGPDVDLVVWRRAMPAALADWIDLLPPECIPSGRFLLEPSRTPSLLSALMEDTGTPRGPASDLFIQDVTELASRFAALLETRRVDLRLDRIDDDACWKFHCDNVPSRLLCTYRGPGTQYVPACYRREALRQQRSYAGPLLQYPRFTAVLLRGSLLPGVKGVLHRSPPMSGCGETRLLLCLNTPSATSPPPWTGDGIRAA